MRKKLMSWILVIAMMLSLMPYPITTAYAEVEGDWTYTLYDGDTKAAIAGYTGTAAEIAIPETISGKPVTRIGQNAFNGSTIAAVTIPDSVVQIDDNAFANNRNLASVTINGNNLLSIGDGAFSTTSLSTIRIPTSLTAIPDWAFNDTALNELTIPANITSIGYYAFGNNPNLNSVLFEGNAPTMGDYVFSIPLSGFTAYYYSGATGFTTPTWTAGYATLNTVELARPITYVCEVDGVQYETLDEAITAAAVDEDTIKLLDDIDYAGELRLIADTWINLNGFSLDVENDSGIALYSFGYDLDISGTGSLNVTGTTFGVFIREGASVEVTNAAATAAAGKAVYALDPDCRVTVLGNATANGLQGTAVYVEGSGSSSATIHGDVYAQGTGGIGVCAVSESAVRVMGRIFATNYLQVGAIIKEEGDYASIEDNYYIYTDGTAMVRARQEVCALNGTPYLFLEDALADAEDGDTIKLLANIRYVNDIVLTDTDLLFDLDSYKLDVGRTGAEGSLKIDGGTLAIDDTDGGELNIVTGYYGVYALNGGTATVTSIADPTPSNSLNGYGIIGESGGSVTVKEDVSVLSYQGYGMHLTGGATAHVFGDIYSLNGIMVQQSGSSAVVQGNISATTGQCASVGSDGSVVVYGDVHGNYRTVQGYGGTIHVMGDVLADRWEGVYAYGGADIVIDGSVTSSYGPYAWGEGTTVFIKQNTTTTDPAYWGAYAFGGAEITVGGTIAADAANYVKVGDAVMTEDAGVLTGRYTVYSDGESAVRTKGIEFFKEDFEGAGFDGWNQSDSGWSITDTMINPTAAAHGGDQVAMFNSHEIPYAGQSRLYQTESLNLSVGTDYWLEFWMYHDAMEESSIDSVFVQISTDQGLHWVDLGRYYRYSETEGWKKEAISLASYAGESDVRIAFHGMSGNNNNIFIDDISVSHECIIDGCSVTEAYGGFIGTQEIEGETFYEVATAEQLAHINDHRDFNYIQTEDIDLSGYNDGFWTPIGGWGDPDNYSTPDYFTGKYLGGGFEIQNLYLYFNDAGQNSCHAGLFAYVKGEDSLVSDLTVIVAGADLTCYNYPDFGTIASTLEGGTISNCDVVIKGDIVTNLPNGDAGGIAATAVSSFDSGSGTYMGAIENCTVTLESGSMLTEGWSKRTGGIAGYCTADVSGCDVIISAGECIRSSNYAGGIAGILGKYGSITECTVTGEGSIETYPQKYYSQYVGGIAGSMREGTVSNCLNEVRIDATGVTKISQGEQVYAGGVAGYAGSLSTISGCGNTGDVQAELADNVVDYYDNPAEPQGDEHVYAGGVAGCVYGYSQAATIENCENRASISAVNHIPTLRSYAGGLAGHIDSANGDYAGVTVLNCSNLGADNEVSATASTAMAGGLAGSTTYADLTMPNILIQNCYNESEVYAESNGPAATGTFCVGVAAGGLVGAAGEADINYCYSTAPDVSAANESYGDAYEGGLFGLLCNTAAIQNYCEANENVIRATGAIVDGTEIEAEEDLPGSYESATADQLKTKAFYGNGWSWYASGGTAPDYYNSTAPWRMTAVDTYPVLKGEALEEPAPPSSGGRSRTATPTYSATASADTGGSIDPAGSVDVEENESITFTIIPDPGYVIADVLVNGVSVGAVSQYTVEVAAEGLSIQAVFERLGRQFSDVDENQWYSEGVEFVLNAGLFKGTSETTFEPNADMTRAMLVTVLWRLDLEPGGAIDKLFGDIDPDAWYAEAVAWAAENGIVNGYDADTFSPDDSITREQMAAILHRYASHKGYNPTAVTDLSSFIDAEDVSEWALAANRWAVAEGLINGVGESSLGPAGTATRAQVATILMRFVRNSVE